jgi:hypothetical protein
VSSSTPADLAVAFRSLGRRLREAIGDGSESQVVGLMSDLRRHVETAAGLLGTSADADAVADAILARRADDWDEQTLDQLRQHALGAGDVLRRIAAATDADGEE